jgi:hypothetical protein
MRSVFAAGASAAMVFVAMMFAAMGAHAEKRVFIISNVADGYGVDRCLATGAECGKVVANSYCRSREFAHAVSFRKVGRDDITGAIPADGTGACRGRTCDNFVAIECSR